MLGSLSFEETAVLSSFQHIKDLFSFRCMFWSQAVRWNSRGPRVALVSTSSCQPVCFSVSVRAFVTSVRHFGKFLNNHSHKFISLNIVLLCSLVVDMFSETQLAKQFPFLVLAWSH